MFIKFNLFINLIIIGIASFGLGILIRLLEVMMIHAFHLNIKYL